MSDRLLNPNKNKEDITSGGKFKFERKKRKSNITIPLDPRTVDEVNKLTIKLGASRCELLRHMIEFASKHGQFKELMAQLYNRGI